MQQQKTNSFEWRRAKLDDESEIKISHMNWFAVLSYYLVMVIIEIKTGLT